MIFDNTAFTTWQNVFPTRPVNDQNETFDLTCGVIANPEVNEVGFPNRTLEGGSRGRGRNAPPPLRRSGSASGPTGRGLSDVTQLVLINIEELFVLCNSDG